LTTPVNEKSRRWPLVLVVVLLAAAGLLWFAWRDQPASPQVLALLVERPEVVSDADNAYFALLGFNAAQGIDPAVAGRQIVTDYESELRRVSAQFVIAPRADVGSKALGIKPLHVSRNVLELCVGKQLMAVACFLEARAEIDKLAQDNAVLVQRYRALIAQRGYRNPATPAPNAPYPAFSDLQRASNLVWAGTMNELGRGDAGSFLTSAEHELGFWRMLLDRADGALLKLVAVSFLRRDYGLLSDAVATFPDRVRADKERWLRLAQPLGREELDWSRALRGEFRTGARLLQALSRMPMEPPASADCADTNKQDCVKPSQSLRSLHHPLWFRTPLYRAQATINRQAENISRLIAITKEQPGQMLTDARAWREEAEGSAKKSPSSGVSQWFAYNPVGKQLADPTIPVERLAQLYDLDGYVRLVNLQIQITVLGLSEAEVGPFLQTTAAEFTNPYTGRAMDWDAKSRTLSFAGHGTGLPPSGLVVVSLGAGGARSVR
jgi:hypothetical protein